MPIRIHNHGGKPHWPCEETNRLYDEFSMYSHGIEQEAYEQPTEAGTQTCSLAEWTHKGSSKIPEGFVPGNMQGSSTANDSGQARAVLAGTSWRRSRG